MDITILEVSYRKRDSMINPANGDKWETSTDIEFSLLANSVTAKEGIFKYSSDDISDNTDDCDYDRTQTKAGGSFRLKGDGAHGIVLLTFDKAQSDETFKHGETVELDLSKFRDTGKIVLPFCGFEMTPFVKRFDHLLE